MDSFLNLGQCKKGKSQRALVLLKKIAPFLKMKRGKKGIEVSGRKLN